MLHEEVDALAIAELAARAQVDPRSIRKRLRGENVRGLAGARIDRALAELFDLAIDERVLGGPR